jgi:hypothetical protein
MFFNGEETATMNRYAHVEPMVLSILRNFKRMLLFFVVMLLGVMAITTQAQDIIGVDDYPEGINPLTGLPVEDASILEQRPVILKVINAPAEVRPQYGLQEADVVWEHLLAGGVTRFAVVYLSQAPEYVGPVRSLRLVDFELTRIHDALVATSGMAQGTLEVLRQDSFMLSRIISGVGLCPALCRDESKMDGRKLEYTLFANVPAIRGLAEEEGRDVTPTMPLHGFAFSEETPEGGQELEQLTITYRNTEVIWTYDAESNRWTRSQDGELHVYAENDMPVQADTVVMLEEEHTEQPYVSEGYWGAGNFAFSVNLIGTGRAVVLRDGQAYEGYWQRDARDDVIRFYQADGSVMPFKAGTTYLNLMPRWVGAYQLVFEGVMSTTGTITATSVNLRWGPSTQYNAGDAGFAGDTYDVIGRNNGGTWVQLRKDDKVLWVGADFIDIDGDVMTLPLARPTAED